MNNNSEEDKNENENEVVSDHRAWNLVAVMVLLLLSNSLIIAILFLPIVIFIIKKAFRLYRGYPIIEDEHTYQNSVNDQSRLIGGLITFGIIFMIVFLILSFLLQEQLRNQLFI